MKNTNKIVSIVVLVAVLVATVAGAYLGFAGRNTQMVTVNVNGEETERALYRQVAFIPNTFNKNWQEAIVPSAQLGGGIEYIYTADQGDMTDAEFAKAVKAAAKVLGDRAEMIAGDASVSYEGDTISVTVPTKDYDSLFASILTPVGDFSLCLYDAATGAFLDPALTNDHIKDAGYYVDSTGAYQLQLQLTKKGQKTLKTYASENGGEALYLLQDGSYVGYLSMYPTMDTEFLNIPVEDWSYALGAAICLRSGELPLAVGMVDYQVVEGSLSALLDIVVMAMLIITVLTMLFVVLRGKAAGLCNALTIAAQGVVFCLILALTAISSDWKLNVGALFLLTACQVLFLGGMILVNEKISAFQKHRALKPALSQAMKVSLKPLSIVYGALVVLGLAMMILFSAQPAAILGRMVAISGIVSFVAIFVALRVLVSCVVTLKKSK